MAIVGEAAAANDMRSIEKIAADVLTYHATPVEVAETAATVGAGHLLYYHVVPPMPIPGLSSVFLQGVPAAYDGPVTLGEDGTAISLPSGSDRIVVE